MNLLDFLKVQYDYISTATNSNLPSIFKKENFVEEIHIGEL